MSSPESCLEAHSQVLPMNVFCLPIKWDIIKAAMADSMRLCCQGEETDLGECMSAAADWKWCIKLLSVCESITSCARTLEVVVSHLNLCITQRHHIMMILFYNLAQDINHLIIVQFVKLIIHNLNILLYKLYFMATREQWKQTELLIISLYC